MMLNEGLQRHSLAHLVMPIVSIDEYESKIDDRRVIVTGFYVRDFDPASDLSSFIEKSSIRPLDTEVSPAPTDDGWYVVFVEMGRDDEFPTRLIDMLDQVSNLTETKKWTFKAYGSKDDELHPVTEDAIRQYINLDPDKVEVEVEPDTDESKEVSVAESIGAFMGRALCESIEIRGDRLRISDASGSRVYRILDFRQGAPKLPVFGLSIGDASLTESMRLQRTLGPAYTVESGDEFVVVDDGEHHAILAVDS